MYGLVDCNNFYCSCERVFHPDLNGKPVVVLSNNDGCVIARSNESKALGLKMGDPLFKVRHILEANNVAVFSSNYSLYGDMSRRVMSILAGYTPNLQVYSIDEAFLDLSGMSGLKEYGEGIVRYIRRGTGIPVSMGIAPTKTLAKMASKFAKKYPGYKGVCIIDTEEKRIKALSLFDVEDVWGIGRRHAAKLKYRGVNTAYEFTQLSESWVRKAMSVVGLRTWRELRGEDCISVDELPHKKSICTSRSFPEKGLNTLAHLEEAVANFAAACCRKLREQNTACGTLMVFAHTSQFREDLPADYIQVTRHLDVATSTLSELVTVAIESLRGAWKGSQYYYKKAGVIVWDICPADCIQPSLFDTVDRAKQERLMKAIDEINRTNGHDKLRVATQGYSKSWHLKNEYISGQYTTNIRDVIRLKT